MPGPAASVQNIRADPAPIVADSDLKRTLAVGHFSFDISCARVLERVAKRLAGDEKTLFAHDRVQVQASSLDADPEFGGVQLRKLLALGRESLVQIGDIPGTGPQILHSVPTFAEQLVGAIERLLH